MKKIKLLYSAFFLLFLFICAVPTIIQTLYWLRDFYREQYNEVMLNHKTEMNRPNELAAARHAPSPEKKRNSIKQSKRPKSSTFRMVKKIIRKMLPEQKEFEEQLVSVFPFRIIFSEISMAFRNFMGMKFPIENSRYYLRPNGTLGMMPVAAAELYPLERILNMKKAAEKVHARFQVIARPDNRMNADVEIYTGIHDLSDTILDNRIQGLKRYGLTVWDMRTEWNKLPDRQKLFFQTDHHWNVYGALQGARILASMLNENCQLDYDLREFDLRQFQCFRLKNIFLGSIGNNLTIEYVSTAGMEDFDILLPVRKTDFTLINSKNHYARGDFSIFLFKRHWKYDPYRAAVHNTWLNGDMAAVKIINHGIPKEKGRKLLFIKDSYCNSMIPYLALQTREIVMLDPRYQSDKKMQENIEKEKPDWVLWIYALHRD